MTQVNCGNCLFPHQTAKLSGWKMSRSWWKWPKNVTYTTFLSNREKLQNAVSLNIIKKTGSSIIDLIDKGKEKFNNFRRKLPKDLIIETTLDQSTIIRRDVEQLVHDGILTIILVTTILFLFVGLKEAFVAGLAVPLVFCATFGLMLLTGITLNFLSLFSLILSLGCSWMTPL